jgi:hypothetical protein
VHSEDQREKWDNLEQKDYIEEPLSHGENSSVENVIDCHSESGLTMELIVSLLDDLFGDIDKLTSINECLFFVKLLILKLGHFQLVHLSLEDHGSEIDVIESYFDFLFVVLFFRLVMFSFVNNFSKSIDDLILAVRHCMITSEVIYCFETLIWVQHSTNTFSRESGAAGRLIQESIEIDAVVVIKQGLKIHDDQIVVVSRSWLLIDMVKDVLNGQSCFIHCSMSQNTLEVEVQGVDEIGVVHQQIFLSEC